jgi:hypothetical protein
MGLFDSIGDIAKSISCKTGALNSALLQTEISASMLAQLEPLLGQISDSSRPLSSIFGDVNKVLGGSAQGDGSALKALRVVKLMNDIASVKQRLEQLEEELDDALDETRRPSRSDQEALTRMLNDMLPAVQSQDGAAMMKRQQQMLELLSTTLQKQGDMQKNAIRNMK